MNEVDSRIVEMQFDNQQFEKNVKTSMNTLEQLKKSLNLDKFSNSFSGIEKATKSFSLDSIADGVNAISGRFSSLGIIGTRVLQNLTDAAMRTGNRIASAIAIDPVKMGYSEYETQINSIQTIMANTGADVKTVNEYLDELNTYADKTIYNFTEMTRNIGTFTAAGVDLDTSVSSIKGIANLAAVSGSTSQQASTAMYQLSQALSSGTVKLQDWNSVVNAGMGGKLFQNALIRTASKMQIVDEKARETFAALRNGDVSFRESLTDGWLTSEVLTKTLMQLTGDLSEAQLKAMGFTQSEVDEIMELGRTANEAATKVKTFTQLFDTLKEAMQSGWTQSWEHIIGDFDEAKALLTDISDYFGGIIGKQADLRNMTLSYWKAFGGRNALIEGFTNIGKAIENVGVIAKGVFDKLFPKKSGYQLAEMTKGFASFTEKIKLFTQDADNVAKITKVFEGIGTAILLIKNAVFGIVRAFGKAIGFIFGGAEGFASFTARISDFVVKLDESIKKSEIFTKIMGGTGVIFTKLRTHLSNMKKGLQEAFTGIFGEFDLTKWLTTLGGWISGFQSRIASLVDVISASGEAFLKYVNDSQILVKATTRIKSILSPVIAQIKNHYNALKEILKSVFNMESLSGEDGAQVPLDERKKAFIESFKAWFENVKTSLKEGWASLKATVSSFFKQAFTDLYESFNKISTDAAATVSGIDWMQVLKTMVALNSARQLIQALSGFYNIGKAFKSVGDAVKKIGESVKKVAKDGVQITKINKDALGNTMLKIAASIGILVASMVVLAKMDAGDIIKSLGILSLLALSLTAMSKTFVKISSDNGKGFLMIAGAVALLMIPISMLAKMEIGPALKGLVGVGIMLLELAAFMKIANGSGFSGKTAFLSLSIAVNLLVLAVKGLASMSFGSMLKGLLGLEAILLGLTSFMKKTANVGKVAGILGMAAALNLMVLAVKSLGNLKMTTLAKGLASLTLMMTAFGAFAKSSGGASFGNSILMFAAVAGSLFVFIEAFKRIEGMDTRGMLEFSLSIASVMTALSVAMSTMGRIPIKGALVGVANLAIASLGLTAIIGVIGAIIAAVGKLSEQWPALSGYLQSGGDMLELLGNALGSFIGGIGAGIGTALSASLPQIGTDLSDFIKNLDGFLDGAGKIKESHVKGVSNFASVLTAIGSAELKNFLVAMFTGENPITSFSDDLVLLGNALSGYAKSVAGIGNTASVNDMEVAIDVAENLAKLENSLAKVNGFAALTGVQDLGQFSENIPGFATAMKKYAEYMSGFTQTVKDSDITNSTKAAEGLAALEASLAPVGDSWFTKLKGIQDLGDFSSKLPQFATDMKAYAAAIKDFDDEVEDKDITRSTKAAEGLAALEASLAACGDSKWTHLKGIQDLGDFSSKLPQFALDMKTYATYIDGFSKDVDPADVTRSTKAAEGLAALEAGLAKTGVSVWSYLAGIPQDLGSFGTNIVTFAQAMRSYAMHISKFTQTVSQEDIDNSTAAATGLATLANALPATDGVWQKLIGVKDLGLFADHIASIGEALASFAENICGVEVGNTENALSVLTLIEDFTDKLNPSGGLWKKINDFFGGSSELALIERTGNMRTVGENLKAFSDGIAGAKVEHISTLSSVFDEIGKFVDSVQSNGGFFDAIGDFFGGSEESAILDTTAVMATVGQNMGVFSEGIRTIGIASVNFETVKELINSFEGFVATINQNGSGVEYEGRIKQIMGLATGFGQDLAAFGLTLTGVDVASLSVASNIVKTLMDVVKDAANVDPDNVANVSAVLGEYGKLSITEFANGFLEGTSDVKNAMTSIMNLTLAVITAYDHSVYIAGYNFDVGFANGIYSGAYLASRAASYVGTSALNSLQSALDEHSPSKATYKFGGFFDKGLAYGVRDYGYLVKASAETVGKQALNTLKTALSNMNSVVDGINSTPTIRPVLDMTDVMNGVGMINGLFDSNRTMRAGMFSASTAVNNVQRMNSAMDQRVSNNADVVGAIDKLTNRFDHLSTAVENMQLVLDGDAVVGRLSGKFDRKLGVMAARRERGN